MENFLARNLKYLRNKYNLGQKTMSEEIGVPQSTLSCWENGFRTPSLVMLKKIIKYFDLYDSLLMSDLSKEDEDVVVIIDHKLCQLSKKTKFKIREIVEPKNN